MTKPLLPPSLAEGYAQSSASSNTRHAQRYMELAVKTRNRRLWSLPAAIRAPRRKRSLMPGPVSCSLRNVANLVPPYAPDGNRHAASAALEFAVHGIGVQHIVVMGHGRCGGIAAAASENFNPLTKRTSSANGWRTCRM